MKGCGKNMNTKTSIGESIAYYRKINAMTQEELARKLNISTQAVSKWEQKLSSPDIMLLPELASIFNITIDELFGKKVDREPVFNLVENVPWDDDRKIRFAVYHGKKLMKQSTNELQNEQIK
jgi:transcriptional regulator with XRE-family HTH domain